MLEKLKEPSTADFHYGSTTILTIVGENDEINFAHPIPLYDATTDLDMTLEKALQIKNSIWSEKFKGKLDRNSGIFYPSAQIVALMGSLAEGITSLKKTTTTNITEFNACKFLTIASQLPLDLQMLVATAAMGGICSSIPSSYMHVVCEEATAILTKA